LRARPRFSEFNSFEMMNQGACRVPTTWQVQIEL
jgi:hypothetical protein